MKKTYLLSIGVLLILAFFFFFCYASFLYPMVGDDFILRYAFYTDSLIESVGDAFVSQIYAWQEWSGRVVTFFLIQTFLLFERCWYVAANTLAYGLSCIMLTRLISKENFIRNCLLISSSFWVLMPSPNSTMFWLSGSFNYMWSSFFSLVFLTLLFSGNKKCQMFAIPLGIIAGNCQETTALAISAALVAYAIFSPRKSTLFYVCLASYVIGFFLNATAPGNYVRLASKNHEVTSFGTAIAVYVKYFAKVGYRLFFNTSELSVQFCVAMWITAACVCVRLRKQKNNAYVVPACILFGAVFSLSLNVASGTAVARSLYGFCFLSYVAFIYILAQLLNKRYIRIFLVGILVLNVIAIPCALKDIYTLNKTMESVAEASQRKATLVRAYPGWEQLGGSRYAECMISSCISDNLYAARYYGVKELSVLPANAVDAINAQKNEIDRLIVHTPYRLANGGTIARLQERPEKLELNIDTSLPPGANAWDKLHNWIDKYRYKDKKVALILLDGTYWAYWKESKAEQLVIHYKKATSVEIPILKSEADSK